MYSISPILKNPDLQAHFDKFGFVKIQLLDFEKTKKLYDNFIAHQRDHEVIKSKYQATTHTNNPELILAINQQIKEVLLPELDDHLQDFEPMMCTYITKQPGQGSETKLHQDPTFVDESNFVSANIWVALHDINHLNGNLFFVKGTHSFMSSLRVTPDCPTAYDKVKDLLEQNLTEVPIKAGEAFIINHSVMHGATPNLSDELRIAAVMAIRSKASKWIYHFLEPGASFDKIERYQVNLDTFIHLQKDGRPNNASFEGYIQWSFPQIERNDFIQKTKELNNEYNHGYEINLIKWLKRKFGLTNLNLKG